MRHALQPRALGQPQKILHAVDQLPVEVIVRHAQDDLGMAVRINRRVSEILAAHVHMRHQVHDSDVPGRGPTGTRFVVGIAGKYRQAEVSGRTGQRRGLNGAAGEDQAGWKSGPPLGV